jgi:hypothetical protein
MSQQLQRFTLVDTSCCSSRKGFCFETKYKTYNLSTQHSIWPTIPYLDANDYGGITELLSTLNSGNELQDLIESDKWIIGKFNYEDYSKERFENQNLPVKTVRILPVRSEKRVSKNLIKTRRELIIDNEFIEEESKRADQAGGSLYDNKGKLLYRGEMKNGLPHGYGTGYYANGKVGHVGMFKGGKIVQ